MKAAIDGKVIASTFMILLILAFLVLNLSLIHI